MTRTTNLERKMEFLSKAKGVWLLYTPSERRNIAIYITGIMFYKLGLEAFNGSITTLAVDRFGKNAFRKQGMLQGLNQAFQVSEILVVDEELPLHLYWRYVQDADYQTFSAWGPSLLLL